MALSDRVILIQDFWRLLPTVSQSSPSVLTPSPITLQQIAKQVDFYIDQPLLFAEGYLAYDRGKVAVLGSHGLYVLVLDSVLDQFGDLDLPPKDVSLKSLQPTSPEHKPSWPNLRLREVRFGDLGMPSIDSALCLQLTETRLYATVLFNEWLEAQGGNMWCYDFGSSQ